MSVMPCIVGKYVFFFKIYFYKEIREKLLLGVPHEEIEV